MNSKICLRVAVLLSIAVLCSVGGAQSKDPCTPEPSAVKAPEADAFCGPAGCKQFDFQGVSFRVPRSFVLRNVNGIEGTSLVAEHDELLLSVDVHPDASRPTFERRLESFRDEVSIVGNVRYWRWEYGELTGWKHSIGVNVWDDIENTYTASIVFFTKSSEHLALGKGIINSVSYEKKERSDSGSSIDLCEIQAKPSEFLNKTFEVRADYVAGFEMGWFEDIRECNTKQTSAIVYLFDEQFAEATGKAKHRRFERKLRIRPGAGLPRSVRGTFQIRVEPYAKRNEMDRRFDYQFRVLAAVAID